MSSKQIEIFSTALLTSMTFHRWSSDAMNLVNHVRTSTATGLTIKTDSVIQRRNSGWEMKTFTCWPIMRTTRWELSSKTSRATRGQLDLVEVTRALFHDIPFLFALVIITDTRNIHTSKFIPKPIITSLRLMDTREMLATRSTILGTVPITARSPHTIEIMTEARWIVPVCSR